MKTINFAVSEHNSRVYSLIFLGDNMKFKKYATKTLMIVIGSIISAYGITLAIGAGFDGATLAILWQGLTNVTGMSIGIQALFPNLHVEKWNPANGLDLVDTPQNAFELMSGLYDSPDPFFVEIGRASCRERV